MCSAAISLLRVGRIYFGAIDDKSGGILSNNYPLNPTQELYYGFLEEECSSILKDFFSMRRYKD
jgi:tRNA(Arg) A34 adenosine deaminase TadA